MRELLIYLKLGLTPILTALLLMLNACSRSFVQEEIFSDSKDVITDIQVLEYMGYDLSRMVEYEDYYLIGDETVSKQRVEEVRNDRKTRVPYRQDQKLNQDCQEIVLIPSGQYESQIREAAESGINFMKRNRAIYNSDSVIRGDMLLSLLRILRRQYPIYP